MTTTVAYVRVSTEDQVEFSPDAQLKRCRDLARLRGLEPVTVLADEGWSGKNLERPAMRELLELVGTGRVEHLLIWRWDRLSRDQGDFAMLVKLFDRHGVKVHSVNEGDLDLASASGRMQIGIFAQYYRDQIVENTRMSQRQAAEQGRWLNRAPTGYDMINGKLVPNDMAPLVARIRALRASGANFPTIVAEVGIECSTVRHIRLNRVYLVKYDSPTTGSPGFTRRSSSHPSSTRPCALTPRVSDAATTSSRALFAAGSTAGSPASTTTIAIRPSTVVVTAVRGAPSTAAR